MSLFGASARMSVIAALCLAAASAGAQEGQSEAPAPAMLDFDDDTIQGDLQRPDGEMVEARRKVNHTNLIRVRGSFREEVLESIGDL